MAKSRKKVSNKVIISVIAIVLALVLILGCCYAFIPSFKGYVNDLLNPGTPSASPSPSPTLPTEVGSMGTDANFRFEELAAATTDLKIEFLDVGQGDCIFITLPDNKHMLIDAGTAGATSFYGTRAVDYIKTKTTSLDYVMLTHADEDHISFMDDVIKQFNIGTLYMPKFVDKNYKDYTGAVIGENFTAQGYGITTTALFENFLKEVTAKHNDNAIKVEYSKAGQIITPDSANYRMVIFAPYMEMYPKVTKTASAYAKNAVSPILILEYADSKIALTGDATGYASEPNTTYGNYGGTEQDFLDFIGKYNYMSDYVDCDILKLGHHGSRSSSSQPFLQKIKPEFGVITVGAAEDGGSKDYHSLIDICYAKSNGTKIHSAYCVLLGKTASCKTDDRRSGNTHNHPNKDVVQNLRAYTDLTPLIDNNIYLTDDDNLFATDEKGKIELTFKPNGARDWVFEYATPQFSAWA